MKDINFPRVFLKQVGSDPLLARARSHHYLTLLLIALLAWPSYLPLVARETPRPERVELPPASDSFVACFQRLEPKHGLSLDHWSVGSDNFEESDGRDESRMAPLVMTYPPIDLPSLVPTSHEVRSFGSIDLASSFFDSLPMRC